MLRELQTFIDGSDVWQINLFNVFSWEHHNSSYRLSIAILPTLITEPERPNRGRLACILSTKPQFTHLDGLCAIDQDSMLHDCRSIACSLYHTGHTLANQRPYRSLTSKTMYQVEDHLNMLSRNRILFVSRKRSSTILNLTISLE